MKNTQKRAADTLLQREFEIVLGGISYKVPQPTLGTLVMISERISQLPEFVVNKEKAVNSVLSSAKDCAPLADILAILIKGAKKINKSRVNPFWKVFGSQKRLSRKILNEATPAEIHQAIFRLIQEMDVTDFFQITTFLQGINLTKPTKVVEQTALGQ